MQRKHINNGQTGMKTLVTILLIAVVSGSACRKNNRTVTSNQWRLVEVFYSIGGPGSWHPADPATQVLVIFATDGRFITTKNGIVDASGSGTYQTTDSVRYSIQVANAKLGAEIKNSSLYIYPVDPLCIEGCNSRYVRVLPD
jgi:hypothetical protein